MDDGLPVTVRESRFAAIRRARASLDFAFEAGIFHDDETLRGGEIDIVYQSVGRHIPLLLLLLRFHHVDEVGRLERPSQ